MTENTKQLESLDYEPVNCDRECVTKITGREKPRITTQPNQNIMIIEQAEGAINVALELLGTLETANNQQEAEKHGCIWTLQGWKDNNLRHLIGAFE